MLSPAPEAAAPGARPQQTAGPFGESVCHLQQLVTWGHGWDERRGAIGLGDSTPDVLVSLFSHHFSRAANPPWDFILTLSQCLTEAPGRIRLPGACGAACEPHL